MANKKWWPWFGDAGVEDARAGIVGDSVKDAGDLMPLGSFRVAHGGNPADAFVQELLRNSSVVRACISYIQDHFSEAPLVVRDRRGNVRESHVIPELIDDESFWEQVLYDYVPYGEAFVRVHFNPTTALPERLSKLITEDAQIVFRGDKPSGYRFRDHGGRQRLVLPADHVIHFKYSENPELRGHGLSRLNPVIIDAGSDVEAGRWMYGVLSNEGIPGLVIMPAKDTVVNSSDVSVIRRLFTEMLQGTNRGRALVFNKHLMIERPSFNPSEFNLKEQRFLFEQRICTMFGIAPMSINLGGGMDNSSYTNYRESAKFTYKRAISPIQLKFARVLTQKLIPWLGVRGDVVDFDVSEVEVLQEDRSEKVKRLTTMYRGGWAKRSEVREAESYPVSAEDDYYYTEPELIRLANQAKLRTADTGGPTGSGAPPGGGAPTVSVAGDNREPGL